MYCQKDKAMRPCGEFDSGYDGDNEDVDDSLTAAHDVGGCGGEDLKSEIV